MISLLDPVELRRDRPDLGLAAGQVGAVVYVHGDDAYEVEFHRPQDQDSVLVALTLDELSPTGVRMAGNSRRGTRGLSPRGKSIAARTTDAGRRGAATSPATN